MEIEAMAVGNNGAATENVSLSHDELWKHEGPVPTDHDNSRLTRHWFPEDFIFGCATASFQVEGAAAKGGRSSSIWDDFSMRQPWKIADGSNGTLACDMYNRYKEDIKMMKQMGFDSYRFSISWSRILPGGRCSAGINSQGIDYYNDVIDTVLEHGLKPFVTLFHWDLPLCLEKEYGGFLSKRVKDDFREFAEVCFWAFGDRVKSWSTLNEPWTYAVNGYVSGTFAPGRKVPGSDDKLGTKIALHRSLPVLLVRSASDKTTPTADPSEAYTVARNLLLAHAEAVHLYRTKFQEAQQGKIGVVLCSHWFYALNEESEADKLAVRRALDFMLGWFLEPILYGHYPKNMIDYVPPDNLASFTPHEIEKLRGSLDFLGLNYYTTAYVADDSDSTNAEGYSADQKLQFSYDRHGQFIGPPSGSSWLYSVPKGIYAILRFLNKEYGAELKEMYITENGWSTKNDFTKTAKMVCDDDEDRTKYFQDHLANILKSMKDEECSRDGLFKKVKGYFLWSWCDNYEWNEGYTARFGLVYVDYMNELTRYPKNAAAWIAKFLKSKEKPPRCEPWFFSNKRSMIEDNEEIETSANKRLKLVESTTRDH